jgi:hypothetical protein
MQSLSADDPTMASAENFQAVVARLIAGVAAAMLAAGLAAAWSMSSATASDRCTHSFSGSASYYSPSDTLAVGGRFNTNGFTQQPTALYRSGRAFA